jgi:hypothetical protein
MSDAGLSRLAGFVNRRSTLFLRMLQRVQQLEVLTEALADSGTDTLIDRMVRRQDVTPFVDAWREQIVQIHGDAVTVGDKELLALARELVDRRKAVAGVHENRRRSDRRRTGRC